MYFLPHLYDAESYLENVDSIEIESIYQDVTSSPKDFSDEFKEFAELQLQEAQIVRKRPEIILDNMGHFLVYLNLQLFFLSKN